MIGILVTGVVGAIALASASAMAQTSRIVPQASPDRTGAISLPAQAMRAGEIEEMDVYNEQGERLGEVERVLFRTTDGTRVIVLERDGVIGIGGREIPVPVEQVFLQDGRLVTGALAEGEPEAVPDWDVRRHEYREYADSDIINVRRR